MQQSTSTQSPSNMKFNLRGILVSLVLNVAIPLLLYTLSMRYISPSEVIALSVASIFPFADGLFEIVRHRHLDLFAALALLGTMVGLLGILLGGDAKILLIKESFFTGALGLVSFMSLFLPRPLMFYFGRQMIAGKDLAKLAVYNAQWQNPQVRFTHRCITIVWGFAFCGEFLLRVVMVYTLPVVVVLGVAPIVTTSVTVATLFWTFAYARAAMKRGEALRQRQQEVAITDRR